MTDKKFTANQGNGDIGLNLRGASSQQIQIELGAALKSWVESDSTIQQFADNSGIHRSSLHRLFTGETVGIDMLVRVLQTLGRVDTLEALLSRPPVSPLDQAGKFRKTPWHGQKPVGFNDVPRADSGLIMKKLLKK